MKLRGGKIIPLKKITDKALEKCPDVKKCLLIKRTGNEVDIKEGRDQYFENIL